MVKGVVRRTKNDLVFSNQRKVTMVAVTYQGIRGIDPDCLLYYECDRPQEHLDHIIPAMQHVVGGKVFFTLAGEIVEDCPLVKGANKN